MGTLTIGISGSAVVNGSKSWTISDADVQSLVSYLIATYTLGQPAVVPTPQQALMAWAQAFVDRTKRDVQAYQLANTVIQPITFT